MATYDWWNGNTGAPAVNPMTGQVDYLSALSPSADINSAINTVGVGSAAVPTNSFADWFQNSGIFGTTSPDGIKTQGWGAPAFSLLSGLGSAYFGAQQLGLARDSLAAQKDQFAKNYAAQQKTTNASLADRQAARVASNPGAYASVNDYMAKYGV